MKSPYRYEGRPNKNGLPLVYLGLLFGRNKVKLNTIFNINDGDIMDTTTTTEGATTTIKTSRRTKAEFLRQIEYWKVTAILATMGLRTSEHVFQDIALNGRFIPSQDDINAMWREVKDNRTGATAK